VQRLTEAGQHLSSELHKAHTQVWLVAISEFG